MQELDVVEVCEGDKWVVIPSRNVTRIDDVTWEVVLLEAPTSGTFRVNGATCSSQPKQGEARVLLKLVPR